MNKMISIMQPFVKKQLVYIYEDNIKTDAIQINLSNFAEEMVALTREKEVTEIELIGPKQYTKGIGNKILEIELTQYKENKINIIYK